jgi:hypothetical protein
MFSIRAGHGPRHPDGQQRPQDGTVRNVVLLMTSNAAPREMSGNAMLQAGAEETGSARPGRRGEALKPRIPQPPRRIIPFQS